MQIKLSYARESTWSLEMVMGQSIRNYKDPSGSAQFGFKEGLKRYIETYQFEYCQGQD
jgi:hypothetical protein